MGENQYRVLQINAGSSNFGGVSSFLYNVYLHIDRKRLQFDFLSPNITTYGVHRDEIEKMGGQIYELRITGNMVTQKIKLCVRLRKFLKRNDYSVIHINSGSFFFNLFAVKIAKSVGIKYRIIHSHNAGDTSHSVIKKRLFHMLKPSMEKDATDLFACSKKAAQYMFTEQACEKGAVKIIKNGIDINRFKYNNESRNDVRKELHIENKFVVGHVGRFTNQKNHEFLIEIFSEIHKMNADSVLLLLGTGEKENIVKQLVNSLELQDCVYFLGMRSDIERVYQAFDVFILPSFHEGLPITCIEIQAAGIPCLLSDTITDEVKINKNVHFLSLNVSPRDWGGSALSLKPLLDREKVLEKLMEQGYSINFVAQELQNYYLKLFEEDT